jgi:hypothetical protein
LKIFVRACSTSTKYWPPSTIWRFLSAFVLLLPNTGVSHKRNKWDYLVVISSFHILAIGLIFTATEQTWQFYQYSNEGKSFVWITNFFVLISKYILLDHEYEFDTRNNFMWITNCKTWRDYCLIICHLSIFFFWYVLLVIPGMSRGTNGII